MWWDGQMPWHGPEGPAERHAAARANRRLVKAVSGLAVCAVHILLLVALVDTSPPSAGRQPQSHEVTIVLSSPPQAQIKPPVRPAPHPGKRHLRSFDFVPTISTPTVVPPPDIAGVGQMLFGCGTEDLEYLAPERRLKCRSLIVRDAAGSQDISLNSFHARGEARWATELARKKAPLLLPCMSAKDTPLNMGTAFCLVNGLFDGFDPDKDPMPKYWDDQRE
jgi:hypothetical protein